MGGANGDGAGECSDCSGSTATLLVGDESASPHAGDAAPASGAENVLVVSAVRTVRDAIEEWRRHAGSLPDAFGLITYAEFGRSASATETGTPSRKPLSGPGPGVGDGADVTVTSMSEPGDLRRLGTAVTLYLDDWTDTDRETLVHVDAFAPFVDASGVEPAFQFLHLLVQSAAQLDADVVVELDPSATDERTINTFRPLFDRTVDATTDGVDDELRAVLENRRRRYVLRSLLDRSPIELDRLATRLACWENDTDDPTADEYERAYTALASIHVPRLAEVGLAVFDRSAGRVRLADCGWSADRLERYLATSLDDDRT